MTYPYPPAGPPPGPLALPPVPQWAQLQLPPGYGCLVATFNRGPYLVPAMNTSRFKIGNQVVPGLREGTWFIPVQAGQHEVKVTDPFGIPMVKTTVAVHPGGTQALSFRFGGWRNRVHDGTGNDVTRFGMWSNYAIMLIGLGSLLVLCLGCVGVVSATG